MKPIKHLTICLTMLILFGGAARPVSAQMNVREKVEVKIISDEADCVMNILYKKNNNIAITESDWQKLFESEGYIRLKKREEAIKKPFTDAGFKSFVLSDSLERKRQILGKTLEKWKSAEILNAAGKTMAYLPEGSSIKAKIYIEIKPKSNSFVFDMEKDPAIFLYLNPDVSKEKFENTLSHELHHIGMAQNCDKAFELSIAALPENVKNTIRWIGAFGEGYAMIAAAGGPDTAPHAVSSQSEKDRWQNDMLNFNRDLKKVEAFLKDIISEKLKGEQITDKGMEFFGIQGPWYTVGWKMSMVIEKTDGHEKLLECICNPRLLLPVYNSAVPEYNRRYNENLIMWSVSFVKEITK
jgi:hypothetical protein